VNKGEDLIIMINKKLFSIFVVAGLLLGCLFGIATKKLGWYIYSGIVIGVIVGLIFTQKS
jgi:hypothetical protein